jgi:hypothetical protein|nr:hypothetical protein [Thiomonas sp.]
MKIRSFDPSIRILWRLRSTAAHCGEELCRIEVALAHGLGVTQARLLIDALRGKYLQKAYGQ